ncbi:MAG: glycosyltransferase, partial [Pseudomonadales bacterium]|nr:glycosyltransferase [Pseudomonadales bacterium]
IEAKSGLCSLTLVGDGSCRSALERQVIDAGLDNWVTFLGSRSDIPELLRGSNCFVLPSEAEGISNTVLEAMATGLPVIATDVGGNADLILPYQTGILVPAKDASALAEALLYYLQDTDRLLEHGKAGLERVNKEFSLPVMTGKYYRIYRDLGKH